MYIVPNNFIREVIKQKKKKNKEDYQKRKEKDRVKKLGVMLEKHTAQLRKEVSIKQDVLKDKLKRQLRVCYMLHHYKSSGRRYQKHPHRCPDDVLRQAIRRWVKLLGKYKFTSWHIKKYCFRQ